MLDAKTNYSPLCDNMRKRTVALQVTKGLLSLVTIQCLRHGGDVAMTLFFLVPKLSRLCPPPFFCMISYMYCTGGVFCDNLGIELVPYVIKIIDYANWG